MPLEVELDRSSPVPLYYQLAQAIEAAIRDGQLAPGDRFENELDLAKRLTLSRPTTRRAIQEIVDKGLLVRKRGVGTQVVQNPVHRRVELTSLFDDLARAGQEPTTELLDYQVGQADDEVADAAEPGQRPRDRDDPAAAPRQRRAARGDGQLPARSSWRRTPRNSSAAACTRRCVPAACTSGSPGSASARDPRRGPRPGC